MEERSWNRHKKNGHEILFSIIKVQDQTLELLLSYFSWQIIFLLLFLFPKQESIFVKAMIFHCFGCCPLLAAILHQSTLFSL